MAHYFNRDFQHLDAAFLQELETLQTDGALYSYQSSDEHEQLVYARLQLEPEEIVEYVDACWAYEEFLAALQREQDPRPALKAVTDERIRRRVLEYNEWARSISQDTEYCPAAFLGEHLEGLTSSGLLERHEVLTKGYLGNRRFLLREILEMFPEAAATLSARQCQRPNFEVENEQDLRDLLFAVIKCSFPDARIEEFAPKHAGNAKRIDILLPSLELVLETKRVRGRTHARRVADELKVDIESYHSHPNCRHFVGYVWDPDRCVGDRSNFQNDLSGVRVKDGRSFDVEIVLKP